MEIGAILKEARTEKQLSLDEIQETTKIQKRYLIAIEEGNFHLLPGKFYARAFIKEYAIAVGLDPDELLEMYQVEIPREENDNSITYSRMRSRKASNQAKSSSSFSIIPSIIVILLIVGILFVAFTLYQKAMNSNGEPDNQTDNDGFIRNNDEPKNTPIDDEDENDEENKDEAQTPNGSSSEQNKAEFVLIEQGTGKSAESTYELQNAGDLVKLQLISKGRTWLAVTNGSGNSLYSGELTPDQSPKEIDISTEDRIHIKTGFAPDLQIIVNDTELEFPTSPNVQAIWINIKNTTE